MYRYLKKAVVRLAYETSPPDPVDTLRAITARYNWGGCPTYSIDLTPPLVVFFLVPQPLRNVPEAYISTLEVVNNQFKTFSVADLLQKIPAKTIQTLSGYH